MTPIKGKSRRTPVEERNFIAWDGEGINLRGEGKPQAYVIFGSSVDHIESQTGLSSFDCLDHIIETGEKYPNCIHVGFAFNYDSNMIIQSLSPTTLGRLHKNGYARLKKKNGDKYTITFAKGKYFRVTKYKPEYHPQQNPHAKITVQIFDIFSFFMSSFVSAYEKMIGPISGVIQAGKAARGEFSLDSWDEVITYWELEIQLMRQLAEKLREHVYKAGLKITQWYGPGALASYALREHRIKDVMGNSPDPVREASRYAYAGGRFEHFKLGRIFGCRIFGVDINSAYPFAIAQLPSLINAEWQYTKSPNSISRFGVYHIKMRRGGGLEKVVSPVFHRDKNHNITFPWITDGWYWSPEAYHAKKCGAEIVEGWELVETGDRPFDWVEETYLLRKEWKRLGISAQMALKLCLNSIYGKLAQRVGWDPVRQRIPPFHQLEWAGWITSYTRARLYDVMRQIPFDDVIAVETDGLYTTVNPENLGIYNSDELGGWSVTEYDDMMYVQSGLAWLKSSDGNWTNKRRGLDPCRKGHHPEECDCLGTFSLNACREFLSELHANPSKSDPWNTYKGQTTRFLGLGTALASKKGLNNRHCVWETSAREILPASSGKRIHIPSECVSCSKGVNAYDGMHDLVINSQALSHPFSYPHTIPWEDEIGHADWRDYQDTLDDFQPE